MEGTSKSYDNPKEVYDETGASCGIYKDKEHPCIMTNRIAKLELMITETHTSTQQIKTALLGDQYNPLGLVAKVDLNTKFREGFAKLAAIGAGISVVIGFCFEYLRSLIFK